MRCSHHTAIIHPVNIGQQQSLSRVTEYKNRIPATIKSRGSSRRVPYTYLVADAHNAHDLPDVVLAEAYGERPLPVDVADGKQ